MIVSDQKISEITPKMVSWDTWTGCGSVGLKTVCTVYSGLVPMSPKTTPRAPTARAPCAVARRLTATLFPSLLPACTRNPNQPGRRVVEQRQQPRCGVVRVLYQHASARRETRVSSGIHAAVAREGPAGRACVAQ